MTRWKAAGIHLGISVVLISLIASGLIALWYGWELIATMGGLRLLVILAICDVAIGPLLTAVVYKPGKKSLKFDLTVIALLQAGFLAYGLWILSNSRPVFMVGNVDRFDLVFANDIAPEDLAEAPPEYSRLPWTGPMTVGADAGTDSTERMQIALSGFQGKDLPLMPQRYVAYEKVAPALMGAAVPAPIFAARSPEHGEAISRIVRRSGRDENGLAVLPIMSKRGSASMIVDAQTGAVIGALAIDPWELTPGAPDDLPPEGTN